MHNIGQLVAVFFLLTRNRIIFYQLPLMGIAALLFGSFIGLITPVFLHQLTVSHPQLDKDPSVLQKQHMDTTPLRIVLITLMLTGAMLLFSLNDLRILSFIALSITSICFYFSRKPATLLYPVRFWFLFLFIAGINLFFSYGTRISALPFLTYEGLGETAAQVLRLWTWLQISLLLNRLDCNRVLFTMLKEIFPKHAGTLLSGLVALEYFADVLEFVKGKEARHGIEWKKPAGALGEFVKRVQMFISAKIK
jgi:hypothetical protein